ncbi:uncharacterized protein LOC117332407 [Pecten maximus]|uniref:uncharacterized protein LOC117332407 n=1 Tax=Pecten maximus TaxID=6579 RepID=UPI00145850A9|nr:uncharacterized protein LOC117332407 [Pecten maximus]
MTPMITSRSLSTTTPSNTRSPTAITDTTGPGIWKSATSVSNSTVEETSTQLPTPGNTTTTVTPTCPCVCGSASSNITNLTKEHLVELVKELAKELTVNKKETSSYKRKLISAGDQRQSAQTIGVIGVLALCIPVLLIVSFDLINLWSFASKKKNKVKPK